MMTGTARFIKKLPDFSGEARLYKVDPPITYPYSDDPSGTTRYVVASATVAYSGPETYLFPANKLGHIIDWLELDGSYRGGLDCDQAIRNAGYEVTQ